MFEKLKIIFLIITIVVLLPSIYARGSITVIPETVEQKNLINITLYPDLRGMHCIGTINSKTAGKVGEYKFRCNEFCRCYDPVSTTFYIDKTFFGDYYAGVFDEGLHDFVYKYFTVVINSCENLAKDDNETDIDCGGDKCPRCNLNKNCKINSDCLSNYCDFNKKCLENNDIKNKDKFSTKELFIISDKDWKKILKLVSLASWEENYEFKNYPVLIYYEEGERFDADSIIQFIQVYSPTHLTVIEKIPEKLKKLLLINNDKSPEDIRENAENYLGAGLLNLQISNSSLSLKDYMDYWNKIPEIVISEEDYSTGILASVFASYRGAPLFFENEIDESLLELLNDKNVYVIGKINENNLNLTMQKAMNVRVYSFVELQKKYIEETKTSKVIIVNPKDLNFSIPVDFKTKKSSRIKNAFGKDSLSAAFLAAAREELIIPIEIEQSPENDGCENNSAIVNNFNIANKLIKTKINELFTKNPEYLTIFASPNSIPDSLYKRCHYSGYQDRNTKDFEYAKIENESLKVGRIYGLTISDTSAYVARDIFYDILSESIYNGKSTGLTIGHSFKIYSDNMQKHYLASTESDYSTECYTGEKRDGCIKKIRVSLKNYSKKQFIIHGDHGFPDEWENTLKSKDNLFLGLSYIFSHSCETNNFWEGKENLMSINLIRKGAISYQGSVGISYADNTESIALQKITSSDIDLGTLNKYLSENYRNYNKNYLFIGDPLINPRFKKINWTKYNFIDVENESEAEIGSLTDIEVKSENKTYSRNENIVIKTRIKNLNSSGVAYLEYDIFSVENKYISELFLEKIKISENEEKEINFSMEVLDTMPEGEYLAIVSLMSGENVIDKKEIRFNISDTFKKINLELKSCEDKDCNYEWNIFNKNQKVYLDFNSSSEINLSSILIFPDESKKIIYLPYEFLAKEEGEYVLKTSAYAEGYENLDLELIFGAYGETACLDGDKDNVCDEWDQCDDTTPGDATDLNGCSIDQFCEKRIACGPGCDLADWNNNEPHTNPHDCIMVLIKKNGNIYPKCAPLIGDLCAN